MRSHADADDRDFCDLVFVADTSGANLVRYHPNQFQGVAQIAAGDGEGHVGAAISTRVLDDHVDYDPGIGDGSENSRCQSRPILHSADGNFALVVVERDTRDQHVLHGSVFFAHPGSLRVVAETRAYHQWHSITTS